MFKITISLYLGLSLTMVYLGHSLPILDESAEDYDYFHLPLDLEPCKNLEILTVIDEKEYFYAPKCSSGNQQQWEGAYAFCINNGMTLAEINSISLPQLNTAINSIPSIDGKEFWTGSTVLSSFQRDKVLPVVGVWQWFGTGKLVDPGIWGSSEPNRLNRTTETSDVEYENCGLLTPHNNTYTMTASYMVSAKLINIVNYKLSDEFCTRRANLICQRSVGLPYAMSEPVTTKIPAGIQPATISSITSAQFEFFQKKIYQLLEEQLSELRQLNHNKTEVSSPNGLVPDNTDHNV